MTDTAHPGVIRSPARLLVEDWTFHASAPSLQIRRLRLQMRAFERRPAPRSRVVVALRPAARWNVLFLFLPDKTPDTDQIRMIGQLRRLSGSLLIVYATPDRDAPPPAALLAADALIWKDRPGFDFSAYALALDAIAHRSPGATAYVQNDSVFGPFGDIDAMVARARWDLTGFVGSATVENHLSSFAFILHDITPSRVAALAPAISTGWCYDAFSPVVVCQESLFARVAARTMSVGSFLYMPTKPVPRPLATRLLLRAVPSRAGRYPMDVSGDPTLGTPLDLLDRGFPFLKRSLFGKFAALGDRPALKARLDALGW